MGRFKYHYIFLFNIRTNLHGKQKLGVNVQSMWRESLVSGDYKSALETHDWPREEILVSSNPLGLGENNPTMFGYVRD